jgi:hypothetical protein
MLVIDVVLVSPILVGMVLADRSLPCSRLNENPLISA